MRSLIPDEHHEIGERAARLKKGAVVMHPGPMNRGIEIDADVATARTTEYPWRGLLLIDTPGVRAGVENLHDEIAERADLFVALPGERGQSQLLAINQPQADGTYLNDITARSAQFVVGEQAWRQTLAQAAFESMMELMGKLAPVAPQVVVATLDLVFEYADLPNKESFLQRVRQATGQPGPDNQQSPEQQAAAAKKAAIDEMTFKLQLAKLQADVSEAQKKGGICAFIDAEHALDPVYARKLGVRLDDLLISQPDTDPMEVA